MLAKALMKFGDARLWRPILNDVGSPVAFSLEWSSDIFPWEFVENTLDSLKEMGDDEG